MHLLDPRNRPWTFGLGLAAVAFAPGLTFVFASVFAPTQRQLSVAVALAAYLYFWGALERSRVVPEARGKTALLLLGISVFGFATVSLPFLFFVGTKAH